MDFTTLHQVRRELWRRACFVVGSPPARRGDVELSANCGALHRTRTCYRRLRSQIGSKFHPFYREFVCNSGLRFLTPALSEVIFRIPRIEVGVYEWGIEIQLLVSVVLDELAIAIIDSDPY